MRAPPLWPLIALGVVVLAAWNAQPFRDRSMHIRTKDLSFLPSPILGRALSLGQCGAAAKLRWIDSFSYFELQLERRDDRIAATGQSGFKRLYDLLIELDPHWQVFYQYASFNTGALVARHDLALGYLLRGVMELPHNTDLWREAAAELSVTYRWEVTQPAAMEGFLNAWAASETTENGKRLVWDWVAAMAKRRHRGLQQIAYWQEQLAMATPGSPNAIFIERTIRDQLAQNCLNELDTLIDLYRGRHGFPPLTLRDLLDPDLLTTQYPQGLPLYGPVTIHLGALTLRDDPFGYPFAIVGGKAVSIGLETSRALHRLGLINLSLADIATRDGRWPHTLEQARAAGADIPELPPGGHYRMAGHEVAIDWDPPPSRPWPLREMLKAP